MIIMTASPHGGRRVAGGLVLAALTVAGVALLLRGGEPTPAAPQAVAQGGTVAQAGGAAGPGGTLWPQGPEPGFTVSAGRPAPAGEATPLEPVGRFRADAQGALVLDTDTLRTLEQVLAFRRDRPVAEAAREATSALPERAQAQAIELAERYGRYEQSLRQVVSPERAPQSVDEMAADLQALQAQRQQWFGEAAARQLFGADEAVTARLIQLMREDTAPAASLEERAMRAQARYSAEQAAAAPAAR